MRNILITCFYLLLLQSIVLGQRKYTYFDGPYVKELKDSIEVLWVSNGTPYKKNLVKKDSFHFEQSKLPSVHIPLEEVEEEKFKRHYSVKKFVAISDIHGQHEIFITLLRQHKVIDSLNRWSYGKGHLVIVGDIMDRGPKVTESLWFLYQLEAQAKKAGGKIHVLLGNHELMVMHGDVGYIHPKYRYTSGAFATPMPDFFSKETILGKWIRSKNITTVINNIGFVHGGFSLKVLQQEASLDKINKLFKNVIVPKPNLINSDRTTQLLYFDSGPLWYRGYANPNGFDIIAARRILDTLGIDRIVVGHTSMPKIVSVQDGKILLIDSSIKFGKSGEILIYEEGRLFRGLMDGSRIDIDKEKTNAKSPFQYVYELGDTDLKIIVNTDIGDLFGKHRNNKKYQRASLVAIHNGEFNRKWNIRIRTRGNMRKKVCKVPPLKIDFEKSALDYLGFTNSDKLKLVLPCRDNKGAQQALYREHVIYKMYQVLDTLGFRTHLVNVILEDQGKEAYDFTGFFIEDEKEYTRRNNARIVKKGVLRDEAILRSSYLKMMFFQYMILNTDFHITNKHNLEIIQLPDEIRPRAIPYDFDYSGMVDQVYAVPHSSLPIDDVRDPLFRGKKVTKEEVVVMKALFEEKRAELEKVVNEAEYLSRSSKDIMMRDIKRFYEVLDYEGSWKSEFRLED